jgi:hypothetical protein
MLTDMSIDCIGLVTIKRYTMKNNIIIFVAGLIVGAGLMYLLRKPEIKEIKVPFKVEVQVPVIQKEFDTIYLPIPKYEILVDTTLVEE